MKNRFRLMAFLSVLLLVTMACNIVRVAPTPIPQSEEEDQRASVSEIRQLSIFTKIDMDGGAAVNLVQGSETPSKLKAHDAWLIKL